MATEQNRFPVEELLRSGPPGARAPTPPELRRAAGVDARDNLARQPLRRPPPPKPKARTAQEEYTHMGDAASAGPRTDQMRALTDWNDRELKGSGINRVVQSKNAHGESVYSNAPGAQGEALFHDMSGGQLNPNDAYNAQRGARRMLSRFGTPQQQRDAARARGERVEKTPQQLIAEARMATALAEEQGKASRAQRGQTLQDVEMQAKLDAVAAQYAQMFDARGFENPDLEAFKMLAADGVNMRDTPFGQMLEAEGARRMQDRSQRRFDAVNPFESVDIPTRPMDSTGRRRDLNWLERLQRWNARNIPFNTNPLGMRDVVAAYDDATPEGRPFARYTTARDEDMVEALNALDARRSR